MGNTLTNIVLFLSLMGIIGLIMAYMYKSDKYAQLQSTATKLRKAVDEMDQQAKLIVRTDMELNKTQEELDKKINGLYTLQKLSRAISTTMEENQIFKMVGPEYLKELGFEKACAFLWDERNRTFVIKLAIGYTPPEIEEIRSRVYAVKEHYQELIRQDKTISSLQPPEDAEFSRQLNQTYDSKVFIIAPISAKEGAKGFLVVGTSAIDTFINEGDEELISILATQLSEALENARLFENTWKAQQELERKVEERTRELTEALAAVNAINKRKTDFISSVSHELRTPLTSIKGYAAILLTGKLGDLPEEIHDRLDKINRHSDELVHMVNDLLDIARIESGKTVMKKEALELKTIIEGIVDLLGGQMKEKRINFSYAVDADTPAVFADHNQLSRVFINIVGNALKFTPQDGSIKVTAKKIPDGYAQIDISDSGCGIPAEALAKIFEEFYRVDNTINQGVKGTGLGLSLVKHIVEAHGGRIWVTSKCGEGATFSFTLPQQP